MTVIAIQPAAQNGTSGALADGKHAWRWATLPTPRTGDRGHHGMMAGLPSAADFEVDIDSDSGDVGEHGRLLVVGGQYSIASLGRRRGRDARNHVFRGRQQRAGDRCWIVYRTP
jgi:hypothetical protein